MKKLLLLISFIFLLFLSACTEPIIEKEEHSLINPEGMTLSERIVVPEGYERTDAEAGSFTEFLRNYPLKPDGSPVLLYDGSEKGNQRAHVAVFELPIENEDLQQCADSVMRVFAEYYWQSGQHEKIAFRFTDGFLCSYSKWKECYRVKFSDSGTSWQKSASYDDSYETFKKYLRIVFSYAGTYSMDAYEAETILVSELDVGDVILKGGSPGHVVMVVDVCKKDDGKKAFLLAQGYMPAQEFHVISNPEHLDNPWYYEEEMTFPFHTAEYTFSSEDMVKRLIY